MRGSVETGRLSAADVRSMFDRIAPVYDVMNHAMTAGLDRRWRRMTARAVVAPGDRVLDACCGTGDLALAARSAGGRVVGRLLGGGIVALLVAESTAAMSGARHRTRPEETTA